MLRSDVDSHTGNHPTLDLPATSDSPQQHALSRQRALPWPRHWSGTYATIDELMDEAALTPGQSLTTTTALQAYQWIMQAVHQHVRTAQSLP